MCMRRLLEQLGRELRSGPRLQLSLGVGVLHGDGSGTVSFEFLPPHHVCKPPAPLAAAAPTSTAAASAGETGAAVAGMPAAGCGGCASPGPAVAQTGRGGAAAGGVGTVEEAGVRGPSVGGGTPRRVYGPSDKGRPASASRPASAAPARAAAHKEQPQQQKQGQQQRGPSRPASPGPGPRPAWGQRQPPPSPGRHAGTAAPASGVGSGTSQQQQQITGRTSSPPRRASCPGSPASPTHRHPYYITAQHHHHHHQQQDHSIHPRRQHPRTRCASSPGLPEHPNKLSHPTDLQHPQLSAARAPDPPGPGTRCPPSPGRGACPRGAAAAHAYTDPLPDHEVEHGTMMPCATTLGLLHRPGRPTSPCAHSRPLSPGPLSGRGGGGGEGLVTRPAWGSRAGAARRQSLGAVCAVTGVGAAAAGGATGRRGGDASAGVGAGCGSGRKAGTWRGGAVGEKAGRGAGRQQEGILWAVRTAPQATDHGQRRQLGLPQDNQTVCAGDEDLQPVRSSSPQGARKSARGPPAQGGAARPQEQAYGGARDGAGGGHRASGDTRSKEKPGRMGQVCKGGLKEGEDDQVWVRDQRKVVSLGLGSPGHHAHNARYGNRAAADAAPHVP